ncbi:MAG TPA: DoxX family protein [Ilumatobacteraceae bacterium]|nr:DoxX family protein [Ilumatobacteraceae bacterium]
MFGPRSLTRPLLAAPFVLGGLAALRSPRSGNAQVVASIPAGTRNAQLTGAHPDGTPVAQPPTSETQPNETQHGEAQHAATPQAEGLIDDIAEAVGLPGNSAMLIRINGAVQVGAGVLFALGIVPRPAAVVLAATLVPSTAAGHPFWDGSEPASRTIGQFAKNAGLLGGLLFAALDTGGRPSVFWRGRQVAGCAANSISGAAQSVADSVANAYHSLPIVND